MHPSPNAMKIREVEALSQDIRVLEDRIVRKREEQQKNAKEGQGGFSFMNAFNIWTNKKEEETGHLNLEKEEGELRNKKR